MIIILYKKHKVIKYELSYKILNDPREILRYLQIGINIPIWSEFHKYILHDLEYFKAKSILLNEDGNPVGNVLLFDDGTEILFFGYFGIINHNPDKIEFLVNLIIEYAKENNYKILRGPINIPVIIFGWGFLKKGSLTNLYAGKPVNPPIYQELFIKNGFKIIHEDITWEGSPIPRINPWKMDDYDFSDYEYFNPKDINDFMKYKSDFLKLHADNMPLSSRITPNIAGVYDNYVNYIFEFGNNFMLFLVKFKPTGKIIAAGSFLPNPFRKNDKGNYDSTIIYTWVVEPDHRKKGLSMLMYGATSLQLWRKKMLYGAGPIPSDNIVNTEVAKKIGGEKGRIHVILEYNF